MKYQNMLPHQLKKAVEGNYPVLMAFGNLEYHSHHLPFGCDGINALFPIEEIEKKHQNEVVLMPTFYYGTSSFAVAGNDKGTISIDSQTVSRFAEELFTNFLEIGFRNVHVFVAHQTENFEQGMPLDLALRFAGRRAIFSYIEKHKGQGWWGKKEMADYYESTENIFDSITVHGEPQEILRRFGGDHAGKLETSSIMFTNPDLVRKDLIDCSEDWFAKDSVNATEKFGKEYINAKIDYYEKLIFKNKK